MIPKIRGIIPTTFIDWEGKISSILFLEGCNWRCGYCHATDLLSPKGESISYSQIINELMKKREWIDGVVICGGEPTIHKNLPFLIKDLKEKGFGVKLDTNGSNPQMLEHLLDEGLLDYVAMDIKSSLVKDRYSMCVGRSVDIDIIKKSIEIILYKAPDYEFRTTVCPLFVNEEDIKDICTHIKGAKIYYLQQFEPINCLDKRMYDISPYPHQRLEKMKQIAQDFVKECRIRGEFPQIQIGIQ